MRVIGAIDVALWDLAGKIAGVPIHRLMGSYRESVPAYASSAVFENTEEYVDEAVRYKENGWQAYKIHPPAIPEWDIKICEAVRKAVGDDYRIMLDSTWSYDFPARCASVMPYRNSASTGTRTRCTTTICTAT